MDSLSNGSVVSKLKVFNGGVDEQVGGGDDHGLKGKKVTDDGCLDTSRSDGSAELKMETVATVGGVQKKLVHGDHEYVLEDVPHLSDYIPNLEVWFLTLSLQNRSFVTLYDTFR
ncbi:hypothetical protein LIER_43722 [Lithospermum erythrorhizon]|uniref:Uncharacterized protein n=1 Tax=Lithospermum erythrorhizon TaxID=34254 RepID=A0AAV3QNI5_LITER